MHRKRPRSKPAWTVVDGTHSQAANTNEQTVFEVTGISEPHEAVALLDLVNLTQNATVRVYEKVDGTTYRSIDPEKAWTTADEVGVRIAFTAQADYKVTLQSGTAEAAARDVPFKHSRKVAT